MLRTEPSGGNASFGLGGIAAVQQTSPVYKSQVTESVPSDCTKEAAYEVPRLEPYQRETVSQQSRLFRPAPEEVSRGLIVEDAVDVTREVQQHGLPHSVGTYHGPQADPSTYGTGAEYSSPAEVQQKISGETHGPHSPGLDCALDPAHDAFRGVEKERDVTSKRPCGMESAFALEGAESDGVEFEDIE